MKINGIKPLAMLPNGEAGRVFALWSGLASKCWGHHVQARGGSINCLQIIGLEARGSLLILTALSPWPRSKREMRLDRKLDKAWFGEI